MGDVAVNADGSLKSWTSIFVAADGEEPDWSTPNVDVDWNGFEQAIREAREVEAAITEDR